MELVKILTMAEIYMDADIPVQSKKYWAITPKDHRAMLDITEVASSDYVNGRPLETGSVGYFMGFNFFVTNLLAKVDHDGTAGNRTLSWSEGGLGLALIRDMQTRIGPRPDKKYATGIYSNIDLGAVRIEGARVHECITVV